MTTHSRPLRALVALALMASAALAQEDLSKVEIKTEKLTDTTYMMIGSGGNLGVGVGDDAVFVIDDQFAPLTPKIEAAIARLSSKPVKFVLNTHWHFDHTGGNANLGKAGALIVAHDNVRKRMSVEGFIEFMGMKTNPQPKVALPVITFSTDTTFHLNGDEIHVFHVPRAHTDGDAIVHFRKSNVVHMGDTFFNKMYPFIDTSSGGTIDGMVAAVDRALAISNDATRYIPGHGPLGSRAELVAYRNMLAAVSARIKGQIGQGMKLDEAIAAKPTADFDDAWGKGFLPPPKFVEMVWKNLQK